MIRKTIATLGVASFIVLAPTAGSALAKNGADDPVPGCSRHCDDGPGHR